MSNAEIACRRQHDLFCTSAHSDQSHLSPVAKHPGDMCIKDDTCFVEALVRIFSNPGQCDLCKPRRGPVEHRSRSVCGAWGQFTHRF